MKKTLALVLLLSFVLSVLGGCAQEPAASTPPADSTPGESTAPAATEPVDDGTCESAQELADNIVAGWNLGLALSAYTSEAIENFTVTAGIGSAVSQAFAFDPATKTASIAWELSKDERSGLAEDTESIQITLHNPVLWSADVVYYRMNQVRLETAAGEVIITEGLGELNTDMGGGSTSISPDGIVASDLSATFNGTGICNVALPEGVNAAHISAVYTDVTIYDQTRGHRTPEGVAVAETSWECPVTTQEMIDTLADRGFNIVRIQVSYINHMDEDGNVDPIWMDRVVEVVDYCMNAGIYCMLAPSGAGWLTADPETYEAQSKVYRNLWQQMAQRFENHGELLIFEAFNEILNAERAWTLPPKEDYEVINKLNQDFVDTVRASGGYNATRNLVIVPYSSGYDLRICRNLDLPKDTVEGHLLGTVHCYDPVNFCFNEINLGSADFTNAWGSDAEKANVDKIMGNIRKRFIKELKIPVIIGEFGTVKRVPEAERAEYVRYYAQSAKKNGIKVIIFDDGGDFTVFDRRNLSFPYPMIIDALLEES